MTASAMIRELASRRTDGIEVRLLWRSHDDGCLVTVSDGRTGDAFAVEVGRDERALDVFHHPYAYAALRERRGVPVAA